MVGRDELELAAKCCHGFYVRVSDFGGLDKGLRTGKTPVFGA